VRQWYYLLRMPLPRTPSPEDIHAGFLAAIYATPDVDAPRLVYMDWLLERRNPRGHFIQLQFERHQNGDLPTAAARKERELLRQKYADWLGSAAELIVLDTTSPTFERGFLHAAAIRLPSNADPALARAPAFSTMAELSGSTNDLRWFLGVDATDEGFRSNLRALQTVIPDRVAVDSLGTWMGLLSKYVGLAGVRFEDATLMRRDGKRVLQIQTHLLAATRTHWPSLLTSVDGRGWTLELASYRYTEQGRSQDQTLASDLARRFPAFRHELVTGIPEQRKAR